MARPREFDEAAALDAAIGCFWERGFSDTSVRDLAREMGVCSASLYNAFGDKAELYRRALDAYLERGFGARAERLAGLPPRAAIEAYFAAIVDTSVGPEETRGCLFANAAASITSDDPALSQAIAHGLARMEAWFAARIAEGQADGSISRARPPGDFAAMLLALQMGVRVLCRSRPDRAVLEGAVNGALAALVPLPQPETQA